MYVFSGVRHFSDLGWANLPSQRSLPDFTCGVTTLIIVSKKEDNFVIKADDNQPYSGRPSNFSGYVPSRAVKQLVCMRWLKRPKINIFFFFVYEVVVSLFFGLFDVCVEQCCPTINQNFILLSCSNNSNNKTIHVLRIFFLAPRINTFSISLFSLYYNNISSNCCSPYLLFLGETWFSIIQTSKQGHLNAFTFKVLFQLVT